MRWDVETERDFDGVKIVKRAVGLSGAEVMVLHYEEECLPGELIRFDKVPHDVVASAMRRA